MGRYNRFFKSVISIMAFSALLGCSGKEKDTSFSINQETDEPFVTTVSDAAADPALNHETDAVSVTKPSATEEAKATTSTPKKNVADDYWSYDSKIVSERFYDGVAETYYFEDRIYDTFDVVSYCLDKGYKITARNDDGVLVDLRDEDVEYYYISVDDKWRISISLLIVSVYTKDFSFESNVYTMAKVEGGIELSEAEACFMSALYSDKERVKQFLLIEDNLLNNRNPLEGIDEKYVNVIY